MRRYYIVLLILAMFISVSGCNKKEQDTLVLDALEAQEDGEQLQETGKEIYVYVCGAVEREGVYRLPAGSRIYEAIEMAGGFREDAAASEVNQAEVLQDEARVYVPTYAEVLSEDAQSDGKLNLNKATKEELMTLPGVGASRAESIIQYRNENGGFKSIEEIMLISGIKEGLFEKIKDLIKV